jgi:hypothetical protein
MLLQAQGEYRDAGWFKAKLLQDVSGDALIARDIRHKSLVLARAAAGGDGR